MRVYRLEVPAGVGEYSPYFPVLRQERHGAFITGTITGRHMLYNDIPAPQQDFPDLPFDPNLFFGFSDFGFIKDYLDEVPAVCILAAYEVEPIKQSRFQVVFHKDTAKFLSEYRVDGVETGINEHIWGVME